MPIFFFFLIISHLFHATTTILSLEYPSGAPMPSPTDMWVPSAEWSVGPPLSSQWVPLTCLKLQEKKERGCCIYRLCPHLLSWLSSSLTSASPTLSFSSSSWEAGELPPQRTKEAEVL